MKAEKLIAIEDEFGAHNYHPLDIVIRKAEGVCPVQRRNARPNDARHPRPVLWRLDPGDA